MRIGKISRLLACILMLAGAIAFNAIGAEDQGAQRYARAMKMLQEAQDEYHRRVALGAAAKESFNQGHDAEAKKYAEELENLIPKYLKDWNYGNAVQDANLVLGRLALKAGDVEAAKGYLLVAGHSPGSPQMNSFGPNVSLAKDLLEKGEKAAVLEYLDLCKTFWKLAGGRIDLWVSDIEADRVPDFGANLLY